MLSVCWTYSIHSCQISWQNVTASTLSKHQITWRLILHFHGYCVHSHFISYNLLSLPHTCDRQAFLKFAKWKFSADPDKDFPKTDAALQQQVACWIAEKTDLVLRLAIVQKLICSKCPAWESCKVMGRCTICMKKGYRRLTNQWCHVKSRKSNSSTQGSEISISNRRLLLALIHLGKSPDSYLWHNKYTFSSSIRALLTYVKIGLNRFNKNNLHLPFVLTCYDTQEKYKQHFHSVNPTFN